MRGGIQQILGKRVRAIVVAKAPVAPRQQVFLIFDDDSHFEFYSDGEFTWTAAVDPGRVEKVRRYVSGFREATILYDSDAEEDK